MSDAAGPWAGPPRRVVSPRVKICGITRRRDAVAAVRAGAAYVGAVLVPGSRRAVAPEAAREIGRGLDASLVALSVDGPPGAVAAAAEAAGARVLQLHGGEPPGDVARIREAGPWRVWKAVRIRGGEDAAGELRRAIDRYGGVIDGLLLDAWHPELPGGTGRPFPWEEVAAARDEVPGGVDVVAAGGLTPANVAEAIRILRPDVVDVSSGVERAPGQKDPALVEAFVARAREAADGAASGAAEQGTPRKAPRGAPEAAEMDERGP